MLIKIEIADLTNFVWVSFAMQECYTSNLIWKSYANYTKRKKRNMTSMKYLLKHPWSWNEMGWRVWCCAMLAPLDGCMSTRKFTWQLLLKGSKGGKITIKSKITFKRQKSNKYFICAFKGRTNVVALNICARFILFYSFLLFFMSKTRTQIYQKIGDIANVMCSCPFQSNIKV